MDVPISKTGLLIVVSGPAGSGKTTLCNHMLMKEPALSRVVTSTTRKPRKGEKDRVDYHFFDHATFEAKIKDDQFYEYAKVHSNLYGTLKSDVQEKLTTGIDLLLVHAARQEPLGRVLLEASAAALPIVATDVGGTNEILTHAQSGLLIPPDDPVAMAEAITRLLSDSEAAQRMGSEARSNVSQRFTVSNAANALTESWLHLLDHS